METESAQVEALNYQQLILAATRAADLAGERWLQDHAQPAYGVYEGNKLVGTLLDVCGNAHVRFRDKRSRHFKKLRAAGLLRPTDSGVIEIWHRYRQRQEHGLLLACATAALSSLQAAGIDGLYVWEYVD